jgi:hypothetical protein
MSGYKKVPYRYMQLMPLSVSTTQLNSVILNINNSIDTLRNYINSKTSNILTTDSNNSLNINEKVFTNNIMIGGYALSTYNNGTNTILQWGSQQIATNPHLIYPQAKGGMGGHSFEIIADNNIQNIINTVKSNIEATLGASYSTFKAIEYQEQIVEGINYIIKIEIDNNLFIITKINVFLGKTTLLCVSPYNQ